MYLSMRPNQGYKTYPHVPGFALSWSVSAKMLVSGVYSVYLKNEEYGVY